MKLESRDLREKIEEESKLGNTACVLYLARQYCEHHPDEGYGWIELATVLISQARFNHGDQIEEAKNAVEKMISLFPEKGRFLGFRKMGQLESEKGDYQAAEQWFRKMVEAWEDTTTLIILGSFLARQGKFEEAKETHSKAIEAESGLVYEAHFIMGLILRTEERYEEAIEFFNSALGLNPNSEQVKAAKQDILRFLDYQRNDALALVSATPSTSQVHPPTGRREHSSRGPLPAYVESTSLGNHRGVQVLARQQEELMHQIILERRDENRVCFRYLASIYTVQYPEDASGWIELSIALRILADDKGALEAENRALALWPEEKKWTVLAQVGYSFFLRKDFCNAEKWYRKSVQSRVTTTNLSFLADTLACQGKLSGAKEVYQKAIDDFSPCPATVYYELGLLDRVEENYPEALHCFRTAVTLDPDYEEAKTAQVDLERLLKYKRQEPFSLL